VPPEPGPPPLPEAIPDFTGKVVKVYTSVPDADWRWWTLDEPTFERQHGRLFLVGRLTDRDPGGSFWGRHTVACLPWETVLFYLVEGMADRQQRKFGGPDVNTIPGLG
jgi:hypothetical protein